MRFTPTVNAHSEFLEIANDFTSPLDIIRECISNAFDAGANEFKIEVEVTRHTGIDELVLRFEDDGEGMDQEALESFFGLGHSFRRTTDASGFKTGVAIGEKGHGTKIYFNSRQIQVSTQRDGVLIEATMDTPIRTLRQGKLPLVEYETSQTELPNGTKIIVSGYNENHQAGFGHNALKDYIFWFTKFGSFELQLDKNENQTKILVLKGLGWQKPEAERISFGHVFPSEDTHISSLKKVDPVSPLDYFVGRWVFTDIVVKGMPNSTIDFVFYIEGDKAKRQYNKMIHEKYAVWEDGDYNVEERYGLWVSKDFIPVSRKNEWISERSEWTKFHAFVNSQDFRLTANRANIDNTPPNILEAIQKTVKGVFDDKIAKSAEYRKYQEELNRQQQYKDAKAEEKDFDRRKKSALIQKVSTYDGTLLIEPRQEGGVYSLVMQLLTKNPDLFGFQIVDYDTAFGYDLLVTKDSALDLNRAALRFVEMKFELRREFSHSFEKLASVICWDTRLRNEETVTDLAGRERQLKITPISHDESIDHQTFMLISDTSEHNIEVFVLKEFLKDKLDLDFRTRTKEV